MDVEKNYYDPWPADPYGPNRIVGEFEFSYEINVEEADFYSDPAKPDIRHSFKWRFLGEYSAEIQDKYSNFGHRRNYKEWQNYKTLYNYDFESKRKKALSLGELDREIYYLTKDWNSPGHIALKEDRRLWKVARNKIAKEKLEKEAASKGLTAKEFRKQKIATNKDLVRLERTQVLIELVPVLNNMKQAIEAITSSLTKGYSEEKVNELSKSYNAMYGIVPELRKHSIRTKKEK